MLKALLINHGDTTFRIEPGDRIAQAVIAPVLHGSTEFAVETARTLPETNRGTGGFGSTGI